VVDEGRNAILCESGAIEELADAIKRFCTNPEMKKSMTEAARAAYLAQYTREIFCDKMESVMVSALKSGEGCRL
jgi:glycosyltransferase involved in cell wall biosynthesis